MLSRLNASRTLPHPFVLKRLLVLFVLAIALTNAVPGYLGGKWAWQHTPQLQHMSQLKEIQKNGLDLPGWRTLEQKTVEIGGHKWSAQSIVSIAEMSADEMSADTEIPSQKVIWLLLRPQTWERDMPQIDWVDINGVQRWDTDSQQLLHFTVPPAHPASPAEKLSTALSTAQITARFFRGWTEKRTNAVLQWYAWSGGGHPAPSRWFWFDQWRKFRERQHLEWIAISIQMPIKPLGDIETVQSEAKALGQLVQSTLTTAVFR